MKSQQYPSDEESYHLPKETKAGLDTVLARKRAMAAVGNAWPRIYADPQGSAQDHGFEHRGL